MENRLGIRLRVGFVCPRRCISFGAGRMRRRNHAFVPTPLPLPGLPPRELSPRVPLRSTHGLRSGAAARLNGSSKEPSVLAPPGLQPVSMRFYGHRTLRVRTRFLHRLDSRTRARRSCGRATTKEGPRGSTWMETPMKRGLPSAPLSGHLKFPATFGNDLTIGILHTFRRGPMSAVAAFDVSVGRRLAQESFPSRRRTRS